MRASSLVLPDFSPRVVTFVLVLISFGLVLVATVLLVLGLLSGSGLALIYISIACSLAAGIVLVVATRINRPQPEAASTGPAPLADAEPSREAVPEPTLVGARAGGDAGFAAPSASTVTAPVPVVDEDTGGGHDEVAAEEADDDFFPIADYDDLKVGEIMPLLPELYADELDVVEERERAGKARVSILTRIEELRQQLAGAPADMTAAELEQRGGVSAEGGDGWDVPDEGWGEGAATAGAEPIAGYDDLTVAEIRDRLPRLSVDELHAVRDREQAGSARSTLLNAVDRELSNRGEGPATRKRAAKKAAAKKTTSRKTAAKKTAARKTAAKKTTARKTAAKKSTAKKGTAKKTAAKKGSRSTKKR